MAQDYHAFDAIGRANPAVDLHAAGFVCVSVPKRLIPYITGVVSPLREPAAWTGTDADRVQTTEQVQQFIVSLVLHEACTPGTIETIETIYKACGSSGVQEAIKRMVTKVWIDYQTLELAVQDGQCCEDRYPIPQAGAISLPQPGDDDWIIDDPPEGDQATRCTKAIVYVDQMASIVDALLDAAIGDVAPWSVFAAGRAAAPGIDFGDYYLFQAALAASVIVGVGYANETESAEAKRRIRCAVMGTQSPGQAGMTGSEYDAMLLALKGETQDLFTYAQYGPPAASMQLIWGAVAEAIGPGDSKAITSGLKPAADERCDCGQSEYNYPSDATWLAVFDFAESDQGWGIVEGDYLADCCWRGTDNFWNGSRLNQLRSPIKSGSSPGALRYALVEWDAGTITPDGNDSGGGLDVTSSGGSASPLTLTQIKQWGSGTIEVSGLWPYDGGDQRVVLDITLANISADRITVSKIVLAGTGDPPVAGATLL